MVSFRFGAALLAAASVAAPAAAQEPPLPKGMKLDRVVLMMRHGVRPPTKSPPLPAGIARQSWPAWPVAPGYLTPHGRAAVRLIAGYDRATWTRLGLIARRGCASLGIVADSDQRTIETAKAYAAALAPGCPVPIRHQPHDVADPIFSPVAQGMAPLDPVRARQAVIDGAGPGGIVGEEQRLTPALRRLDAILCGGERVAACGVTRAPTTLLPAAPNKRPKLAGALDTASTAAQILLLEYADGKPMAEVGWGRASPADIARLSAFHAAEFRLLARPRYLARANMAGLTPLIVTALTARDAPRVTMLSGHDTDVASLGGLLDAHWTVPGLAADDPSPGGAIVLERLVARDGRGYVRALYRSQTIEQIRALATPARDRPYVTVLAIPGCSAAGVAGLCDEAGFRSLIEGE